VRSVPLRKEKHFLWVLFILAFLLRAAYVLQKDDIAATNVDGYPDIARFEKGSTPFFLN